LLTASHGILDRWRNHFSQLFSVHYISDIKQTEILAAEPLVPEPRAFEIEMAFEELKIHQSPSTDQIPAEMLKAASRTIRFEIHILINSMWNKEKFSEKWKE